MGSEATVNYQKFKKEQKEEDAVKLRNEKDAQLESLHLLKGQAGAELDESKPEAVYIKMLDGLIK